MKLVRKNMKEVLLNEGDNFTRIPLEKAHAYLREILGISDTVYGCFPPDIDEIAVRYNDEDGRKIYITVGKKLFELDLENKRYALTETDLRELKQK